MNQLQQRLLQVLEFLLAMSLLVITIVIVSLVVLVMLLIAVFPQLVLWVPGVFME